MLLDKEFELKVDLFQKTVTNIKNYKSNPKLYLLGKLTEETGEIAKEIVKGIDGLPSEKDLTSELGDLLWCINAIAEDYGIKLSDIMRCNIEKLDDRNLL